MSTAFTFTDVLVEVSDSPALFNALSPAARQFLLYWLPSDSLERPDTAATLAEIVETPDIFNALSPQAREFLLGWL